MSFFYVQDVRYAVGAGRAGSANVYAEFKILYLRSEACPTMIRN